MGNIPTKGLSLFNVQSKPASNGINPEARLFSFHLGKIALSNQIALQMERSTAGHSNRTNGAQMGLYGVFWDINKANHVSRSPSTELNARGGGFALDSQFHPPITASGGRFSTFSGPFF